MWKFWKKEEKPKSEMDALTKKVDTVVAETDKDLQEISHPRSSKASKSVDDSIVTLKSELKKIEKKK
ncbi:MAG: hypothetical protein LUQ54_02600 [Methanoregula sp.]|nr:hypothetical protein [Methanoregula sp.]